MEKTIHLTTNYTLYKADTKTIALILVELWIAPNIAAAVQGDGIAAEYAKKVPHMLRTYQGRLKKWIHERTGHNIVPLAIRSTVASMIVGQAVTPTMEANYMALGTGWAAPTENDETLETEYVRGTFSNRFAIDNVAYLDKFFSSGEVGGQTFLEAGIFVDGTGSADTGFLLSRINIDETVAATETITINATFTIS